MNIKLEHPFQWRAHDLKGLLTKCNKVATFCNRLERQCNLHPNRYPAADYLGDGLELLAEALIKLSPVDNRIGIGNYKVITATNDLDTGVDGIGIGVDRKPAAVQVKYRRNDYILTANVDRLTNFTSTAFMKYKVDPETTTNLLIITTAKNLHHFTNDEMFLNKVRTIGYEQLRDLLDNNNLFWDSFRKLCNIE